MRILVCGGRDFNDYEFLEKTLDGLKEWAEEDITEIIHGGATGVDTKAGEYAASRGIGLRIFKANWKVQGRAAGPIRNKQMLDEGQPDLVIAFPGGKGTANMIKQTQERGIDVRTVGV